MYLIASCDYAARQRPPTTQASSFFLAHGSEPGNLICSHLRLADEVVPSNDTVLILLPAFFLLCFYNLTISSASGGKLEAHNDPMDLQIARLPPSSPGQREGMALWGFMKGRTWRSSLAPVSQSIAQSP